MKRNQHIVYQCTVQKAIEKITTIMALCVMCIDKHTHTHTNARTPHSTVFVFAYKI